MTMQFAVDSELTGCNACIARPVIERLVESSIKEVTFGLSLSNEGSFVMGIYFDQGSIKFLEGQILEQKNANTYFSSIQLPTFLPIPMQ